MTAIMITLAAVVLLILTIGFFARRFLRAEGSDPFLEEDDAPTGRGRSRGDADDHDRRPADRRGDNRVVPLARPAAASGRAPRRDGDRRSAAR